MNSTANLSLLDAASALYINALVWTLNITSSEFSIGSQKFKYGIYHKFLTYNITGYQRHYMLLPDYADSQCNEHKSGTLCRGCIDNYTFTYDI